MSFWDNSVLGVVPPVPRGFSGFLVGILAPGFYFQKPLFALTVNPNFSGVGSTEFG